MFLNILTAGGMTGLQHFCCFCDHQMVPQLKITPSSRTVKYYFLILMFKLLPQQLLHTAVCS